MKTTNYVETAIKVVNRLNDKFGKKIFVTTGIGEIYCRIQNRIYKYEGNDVRIMISDEGIEGSITGATVRFDSVDDLIDRIDELFEIPY